jgi:carbamoyltransferase
MTAGVVLGVCAFTHDSSAALLIDGKLVGLVEQERLDGVKHSKAYPADAIVWLLDSVGLSPQQVETVAYNFHPSLYGDAVRQMPRQLVTPSTVRRAPARAASFVKVSRRTRERLHELGSQFPNAEVRPVAHHRAHAWTAWLSSGYDDAAVLIADSLGETQASTIWHARRSEARPLALVEAGLDPSSLGYVYGAITEHLGWRRADEEGTVMALAALGDPQRFRTLMAEAIPSDRLTFGLDTSLLALRVLSHRYTRVTARFVGATCPPRPSGAPLEQVHADLAAALQERTEQLLVAWAARARQLTSARLLAVGGGVAMNCVAIGKILTSGAFDEVHVPSAPGDSGTSFGAAADVWHARTGDAPAGLERACYLGPSYPALSLPPEPRPGLQAARVPEPARYLAERLAAGTIVGLFTGELEAGPRALGHRSILASPLAADVVDRLNQTVKFREPFRPFAPVLPAEVASDYFEIGQASPFMSIAVPATALTRTQLPALVHTNGLSRVQTVALADNPFLRDVLHEFGRLTGHPVLINTSLNIKGKPICGTPEMALDCLQESGIDALLIEGWWVTK